MIGSTESLCCSILSSVHQNAQLISLFKIPDGRAAGQVEGQVMTTDTGSQIFRTSPSTTTTTGRGILQHATRPNQPRQRYAARGSK